jgi:hypothetical protein
MLPEANWKYVFRTNPQICKEDAHVGDSVFPVKAVGRNYCPDLAQAF